MFILSGCISKKEIQEKKIKTGEFVFDGNRWSLNLPYEVDYDDVESMKFDLHKMRKSDGEGKLNFYYLIDDATGLILTSNESHHEYVKFDINTGELFGKFVFHEDISIAIDFVEVLIDGKKPSFLNRYLAQKYVVCHAFPVNYFGIREATERQNDYFVTMTWNRIDKEGILWYDGGGPRRFRGYFISSKSKMLDITYRITLPYPSMTIENLFDKNYKYKNYSKEYKIRINLEDFFNSDSFKLGKVDIQNN